MLELDSREIRTTSFASVRDTINFSVPCAIENPQKLEIRVQDSVLDSGAALTRGRRRSRGLRRVSLAFGTCMIRPILSRRPRLCLASPVRCTMALSNCAGTRPRTSRGPESEFSAAIRCNLLVSEGFAVGFITLADHSKMLSSRSTCYLVRAVRGVPLKEPVVGIAWSGRERVILGEDSTKEALEVVGW